MSEKSLILVTGATGAVGPQVVEVLYACGYRIRTLSIDTAPPGMWPDDVEARIGDVTELSAVQSAMEGVDGVIHLAAMLHILNPSPSLREAYELVNVGGTANVVKAATHAHVKRVVLFSTIAVYGDSSGSILTEDSPLKPSTLYAQTKQTAERIVLNAKNAAGQPLGVVLRLGAVYGARIKGNYRTLLIALARNRFIPLGDGNNRRSLIYDKDIARAAVLALAHPDAAGQIFNVTDGRLHTMEEIIAAMCRALDRPLPRFSIPASPVRFFVGILEDCARALGLSAPIGRWAIDKYIEDMAVDSSLITKQLGFIPQYDLNAGWRETVAQIQRIGKL